MRKIIILGTIFLFAILMSRCIHEDMDDCSTPLSIFFSYKGDSTTQIFSEKIENVSLYVYNEKEVFVKKIYLNKKDLNKRQGVELNLPDGKYHLVLWGNVHDNTYVDENTLMSEGMICSNEYFLGNITGTNDSLYYGSREIKIPQDESVIDTIEFVSAHIKMEIMTSGLDDLEDTSDTKAAIEFPFYVEVGNLSSTINFRGLVSSQKIAYYPSFTLNDNKDFNAKFNVMRFNNTNDVYINLRNKQTNNIVYTVSLMQFMQKYNIKVDGINEAVVAIRIVFNGTSVSIKPWGEEDIRPNL